MILDQHIKGILFDKDGTVIEFQELWHAIFTDVFDRLSLDLDLPHDAIDRLKKVSGYLETGFTRESLIQYKSTSDIAQIWSDCLGYLYSDDKALGQMLSGVIESASNDEKHIAKAMPGAIEVLSTLKARGYALGIATADSEQSMLKSLCDTQLLVYFDFLGCDDGLFRPKPEADLGNAFAEKMGLMPDAYCVVGDSVSDMAFAHACKVPFIGIESDYSDLQAFEKDARCIRSLYELLDIFK